MGCLQASVTYQRSPMLYKSRPSLVPSLCSVSVREQPWGSMALQWMWQWIQRGDREDLRLGLDQLYSRQPIVLKEFWAEHFCSCTACPTQIYLLQVWRATHWFPRLPLKRGSLVVESLSAVTKQPQLVLISVFHHSFKIFIHSHHLSRSWWLT